MRLADLDTVLATADVVSLHLTLSDDTRGLIDAARIARMKPGVILVNTARGALVDEAALIDALKSGHIRHAGLDVFHAEPLKSDHPLASMDNVTLSSHAAFRTRGGVRDADPPRHRHREGDLKADVIPGRERSEAGPDPILRHLESRARRSASRTPE